MSRLTLHLPENLHRQLAELADSEGIPLNQYIVKTLTRQVASAYVARAAPTEDVNQQQQAFLALLKALGQASSAEIESILEQREVVQPEKDLSPDVIAQFQQRLRDASES